MGNDSRKWVILIDDLWNKLNEKKQEEKKFISLVSHEIRTPIAVIQGYIEIIEDWGRKDENVFTESVNAIKEEIFSMKSIIEKILLIVREENNNLKFNLKKLDIGKLVEDVFYFIKNMDTRHEYYFENNLDGIKYVNGDKNLLEHLIKVIIENSVRYTGNGKKICVKITENTSDIKISIIDNGNGIPKDQLPKIFDKYYGIDNANSVKTKGLGIGLTTAKMICEIHKGTIKVESIENKGTKVIIILPLATGV